MRPLFGALLLGFTACTSGVSTTTSSAPESTVTSLPADSTGVAEVTSLPADSAGVAGVTSLPADSAGVAETAPNLELPPAPWAGLKLPSADVDTLLLDTWLQSANHGYCSLLAPVSFGPDGENAVPRRAGFTHDDWSVAWDNPDGPGMTGSSEACDDCGRSAFGILGSSGLDDDRLGARWSDGSGMELHRSDFHVYADGHNRVLANLAVAGQPCSYSAFSSLGEEHLLWFVDQLRFVDGYYSEPIEPGFVGVSVTNAGDPPWAEPPLKTEDVDALLLERWDEAADRFGDGVECPLMALADLGGDADEATIRTARFGGWGVAWDNPDGPGHDGFNGDCSDCGRGVVGLSGGDGGPASIPSERPYRVEWNDGSYAAYGYDGHLYNQLPPDRIETRDPQTGEITTPPLHAYLAIADQPWCTYELWTHLGTDHIHYLFEQLRYVNSYP